LHDPLRRANARAPDGRYFPLSGFKRRERKIVPVAISCADFPARNAVRHRRRGKVAGRTAVGLLLAAEQAVDRRCDVGLAHQRFADEYCVDPGSFQAGDVGMSFYAALADHHALGGNLRP
jgi:hypothetical protein